MSSAEDRWCGTEVEEALHGASRIEVGEEYVIALVWKRAECDDNDYYPARWSAIGSGGVLPMHDGVIGHGEFEGQHHTGADGVVGPPLAQQFGGEAPEVGSRADAQPPRSAAAWCRIRAPIVGTVLAVGRYWFVPGSLDRCNLVETTTERPGSSLDCSRARSTRDEVSHDGRRVGPAPPTPVA